MVGLAEFGFTGQRVLLLFPVHFEKLEDQKGVATIPYLRAHLSLRLRSRSAGCGALLQKIISGISGGQALYSRSSVRLSE